MKYKEFLTRIIAILAAAVAFLLIIAAVNAGKDPGFVSLFNGKDLTGWTTTGNWLAEDDDILEIKPREGEEGWKRFDAYLWSEKEYTDFIIDLEFKYPEGGNSGVFLRVADPADPVTTGLEVQILDSYGKDEPLTNHDMGGVIKTAAPSKNMSKPAGEWNRMTITCKGSHLKVKLNDETIVAINLSETGSKENALTGYLGLQDHGQILRFRNIRIKEL